MSALTQETRGVVRIVRIDDGKANALTAELVAGLANALRTAESEEGIQALALLGRPGRFCVGLDNATLQVGGAAANDLLARMGALLRALYASPLGIVSGASGHAVAAGAMLLLVSDWRVGATGDFRFGFSEVGIGMPLPELPILLARDRLSPRFLSRATAGGELFAAASALEAGFLDAVALANEVEAQAVAAAQRLGALSPDAVGPTRAALRRESLARMDALLATR